MPPKAAPLAAQVSLVVILGGLEVTVRGPVAEARGFQFSRLLAGLRAL